MNTRWVLCRSKPIYVDLQDTTDVDVEEQRLTVVDRPAEKTELKNGSNGERPVTITAELAKLPGDHIESARKPGTDEYGLEPLFSAENGRLARASIRRHVYIVTAPCFRNEPCDGCTNSNDKKCPDAVSPHAVRRGSITHFLTEDVPVEIVGDRIDVIRKVLKEHYVQPTEEVKLGQQWGYLDDV